MSKAISLFTGPIYTILSPNGGHLREFYWLGPFFPIPQGTLPWQPIKVQKLFYSPIYFVALPFGNGLQYHNSDFKRLDRMNISTSCAILVTFRPQTSEFTLLTIATFVAILQRSAYHAKYLRMFWTYFTGLVGALVGIIFQTFLWKSPKGRCYGNQLNMEDVRKHRVGSPLLFASAFDNWLADCKSAYKRFNGNNQATSCPNLVKLRPVTSEFTLLKRAIFAVIRP